MALTVEDGSVVTGAESLASVADADAYHDKRGNTAWAALATPAKEANLRKGTDYLVQNYRSRWKGYRVSALQVLDFPRYGIYMEEFLRDGLGATPYLVADNIVPTEVKNAVCELALRAIDGELSADLTPSVVSETVGPISTTYNQTDPQYTRYRAVDNMLTPFLKSSSFNSRVVSRY